MEGIGNGETTAALVLPVLPRETTQVSQPYLPRNSVRKNDIDAKLLANRGGDAAEQTKFLDELQITGIDKSLGICYEPAMKCFNGDEVGVTEPDSSTRFLQGFFPREKGYKVFDQGTGKDKKLVVTKEGNGGVSDMVLILKDAKHRVNQWEFVLEKYVYLNRDNNRAFDLIGVLNDYGCKSMFYFDEKGGGWGGMEDSGNNKIGILISKESEAQQKMAFIASHELGHTFQIKEPLNKDFLHSIISAYSSPLRILFPKLTAKITPDFMKENRYQSAVEKNLQERNASAFALALRRRLQNEGLHMVLSKDVVDLMHEIKTDRMNNRNYKPID